MLNHYARVFVAMSLIIRDATTRLRLEEMGGDTLITEPSLDDAEGWSGILEGTFWTGLRGACEEIDLDSATDQIDRICQAKGKSNLHRSQLRALLEELNNRIKDQLMYRWFVYVPQSKAHLWENETLFGDEVFNKISEATYDICEAGSCLAVGRPGGTVYHCMGIMQAALFKVGQQLGCPIDLDLDDWGSVEKKIAEKVDDLRKVAEAKKGDATAWALWKQQETNYSELLIDLSRVKKAWRHPSAHFRQVYTLEHAAKIFDRVEDFAKQAATLLT